MKVGYARVSKSEQAETEALDQQIARLKSAGAERIFVDIQSGRKDNRKEFQKMMGLAQQGAIATIVITRLDRLGRSVISLARAMELLEKHKVKLEILDAPIDLSSPFGWFGASQMAALAEFESRLLSNRVKHGYEYLRSQNKANPKVPFGYCRNQDKQYAPNHQLHPSGKTYWEVARGMVECFFEAGTLRAANLLARDRYGETRSPTTLRQWLLNPVLRGHTVYGRWHNHNNPEKWDLRYSTHEALITEEEYNRIQSILAENKLRWGFNQATIAGKYPLAGQVRCGVCGGKCYLVKNRQNRYLVCRKSLEPTCTNSKSAKYDEVIGACIEKLCDRAEEIANQIAYSTPAQSPRLTQIERELHQLKSIPLASEPIKLAIAQLEVEYENLIKAPDNESFDAQIRGKFYDIFRQPDGWLTLSPETLQEAFKRLIEKVLIVSGEVSSIDLRE